MSGDHSGALRRVIAVLACLIVLALAALAFVLVRYAGAPAPQTAPAADAGSAQTAESAATPIPTPTAVPTPEPTAEPPAEPAAAVDLPETADMGQEYQDKLVFLGDSTTYGMRAYDVVPTAQIWTPASGTLALFNWAIETIDYHDPLTGQATPLSISDCASVRQPEVLVITLGVNGIAFLDEASFKQYYTDLVRAIQAVSPNTKIICHSLYPVIDSKTPGGIDNARVNAANVWVRDVAAATGARYLNSHDLLTDESGGLRADYSNGDDQGIHLNAAGFAVVLQNLRTHPYQ